MSERHPTHEYREESFREQQLASLFFEQGFVDHLDRVEHQDDGGTSWYHAFAITKDHYDLVLDQDKPGGSTQLTMQYYQDGVIGYWVASGLNDDVAALRRVDSVNEVAYLFLLCRLSLEEEATNEQSSKEVI